MRAVTRPKLRPISDEEEAEIQRGIALDPDNPELTDEELAGMRPARELLPPEFFVAIEAARRSRGRPAVESPKKQVTLRLDSDVVARFREGGPGWQSRMNDALRKAVGM